ncbi:unnamed protein product [Schistocephalus solidus]|uniref:Uncharacterized protein n=1 Tax=Schistocephalus solidus TaxID=70667 RepID=A0A183SJ55_SCHSO|nr:unnamed protein product [Schistocephalus solidus]
MSLPLGGIRDRCGCTLSIGSGRASYLRPLPPLVFLTLSSGGRGESAVHAAKVYHFKLNHAQATVPAPPFRGAYGGPRRNRRSNYRVATRYGELMNTNAASQQFFQLRQASQLQQHLTAGTGIPLGGVPVGGPYFQCSKLHQHYPRVTEFFFAELATNKYERVGGVEGDFLALATAPTPDVNCLCRALQCQHGRPGRVGSLGQAQMTGMHPNSAMAAANMHALAGLGLISSNALLQAQAAAAAANAAAAASAAAPPSAGGSGSVVYENSYNSFQRLPVGQCVGGGGVYLPSAISQDFISGCNGVGNSGIAGHPNGLSPSQANTMVTGGTSVPSSCPGGGPQHLESAGLLLKSTADGVEKTPGMPPSSVGVAAAPLHPSVTATGYLEQNYAGNSLGAAASMRSKPADAASSNAASKPFFWRCSWHYWVILICVLAFLLTLSFAVFFSENAKWLENRLHERFSQDPIIFGE